MVIWKISLERKGKIYCVYDSATWEIPPLQLDTIEELIEWLKTDVIRTTDEWKYVDFMNRLADKHYHRWEEYNKETE